MKLTNFLNLKIGDEVSYKSEYFKITCIFDLYVDLYDKNSKIRINNIHYSDLDEK
jgi:hypothetical protein